MSPAAETAFAPEHIRLIAGELSLAPGQVAATASLLAEGATVPFISRYRKEATGSLDEVAVMNVRDRLEQLAELDKRRQAIFKSLNERELLTPGLQKDLEAAGTLARLEDLYLPFRPKRRTRATMARERGLEPLATWLLETAAARDPHREDPLNRAVSFVDPEKEIPDPESALAGARDIVAEIMNEDAACRDQLRRLYLDQGLVSSRVLTGKEGEGAKFRDYFDWSEPVRRIAGHRMLAMRRGENEKVLALRVVPPEEPAVAILTRILRPLIAAKIVMGENISIMVQKAQLYIMAIPIQIIVLMLLLFVNTLVKEMKWLK